MKFSTIQVVFQINVIHAHSYGINFLRMHFTVNENNYKLQYSNLVAS